MKHTVTTDCKATAAPAPAKTTKPATKVTPVKTTKPEPKPTRTNFKNCTELRTVYPAGVAKGHAAYQPKMDRDKDGWACE